MADQQAWRNTDGREGCTKNTAKPVRIPLVLRTQQNYNIYCQKLIMLMKMLHSLMEFFNLIIPVLWVS